MAAEVRAAVEVQVHEAFQKLFAEDKPGDIQKRVADLVAEAPWKKPRV